MPITHNKSTDHDAATGDASPVQRGTHGELVIIAMTPAVVRLAQVARAMRHAPIERTGRPVPIGGKSPRVP